MEISGERPAPRRRPRLRALGYERLILWSLLVGLAVSIATGGAVSPSVAILCTMAAVNVAVTKTPISSSVILTSLSGTSMLPVIGAASLASFLLTTRVSLIRTQRPRRPPRASA